MPSLLSLKDLQQKYLEEAETATTLFMINNKTIHSKPEDYLVDEKFIMKIEVETISQVSCPDLKIIRLTTRTAENLADANTILVRGL